MRAVHFGVTDSTVLVARAAKVMEGRRHAAQLRLLRAKIGVAFETDVTHLMTSQ